MSSPGGNASMTTRQRGAICLTALIAAADGFDGLAMAFVAPALSAEWNIDKSAIGLLLSCTLFGMAGGALALAPLADVVGRKPTLLGGIALMCLGSFASATANSVHDLAVWRILTGLGVGVLVALTASVASEFANEKTRPFAVATVAVGFSLGGVLGGLGSAVILSSHHWSAVFSLGGFLALALGVVTSVWLPETPAYLATSRSHDALERLNRALYRLGLPAAQTLPAIPRAEGRSYRRLFAADLWLDTVRYAATYTLIGSAVYYLQSWLPQLIADSGHPASLGSVLSACLSLAGIAGALLLGAIAYRVGPTRLAALAMCGFALSLAALGHVPPRLQPLVMACCVCGFFMSAATAVFNAAMTTRFPASVRASGLGFVMGVGRILSAMGPLLAGHLFARGFDHAFVSSLFAGLSILAALLLVVPLGRASPSARLAVVADMAAGSSRHNRES